MKENDSLDALLREEWKAPEPPAELDRRVDAAYRSSIRPKAGWRGFWRMRVSIPAPALVAVMLAIFAIFFWLRPTGVAVQPAEAPGAVTQLNASGFQPLPNGEARIVPAVEVRK